jgi:drug/metabolite transporter (DMT)-like permease
MKHTAQANTMTPMLWAMLILLSGIWGGSFLFGRIAVQEISPLTTVFLRVSLAALAIWIFVLLTRRSVNLTLWLVGSVAIMSILNNVIPFTFILYGQKEIGSGLASIVNAMTPIWTVLIANWLTSDEKLSRRKLAGILFGFLGVALLMGGDAIKGLSASAIAQSSVLVATVSYGFAGVFGKRFKGVDPILIAALQLTASTIFMALILAISGSPFGFGGASRLAIWSVIGIAIPCTAFAYVLFFHILANAGATNVSLVTFLVPVSGILLGIIFLGETLTPWHLGGMGLIGFGLLILDGRLLARNPA